MIYDLTRREFLLLLTLINSFCFIFFYSAQLVKRCEEEINQLDRVQNLFPNDQLYLHDKDALSLVSISSFLFFGAHFSVWLWRMS